MKILAGYPARLATLKELKRQLALLATSGPEWSDLTRRLAAEFPQLDIFTLGFVERYSFGWRLTHKGLVALETMEHKVRTASIGQSAVEKLPARQPSSGLPLLDLAVGDSLGFPAPHAVSYRPANLSSAERRSQFAVIDGGKNAG